MSSRYTILAKLHAGHREPRPLPTVPLNDDKLPPVLETFKASLACAP